MREALKECEPSSGQGSSRLSLKGKALGSFGGRALCHVRTIIVRPAPQRHALRAKKVCVGIAVSAICVGLCRAWA